MILLGAIANAGAILVGGTIGAIAKKGIPQRFGDLIISALGLFTFVLGVQFAMKSTNFLVVVFSLILGAFIGEGINIEDKLDKFGNFVQSKLNGFGGSFSEGFVTSSLLFCVGSMAIMGSLESGLSNNHTILLTKSTMDGIISIIFASTMGIGVAAAFLPVLIYQGGLTLLASVVAGFLSEAVITEMTATGGILLMGLCLSILNVKKIKVGNLLPAIFIPIILMQFLK